MQLQILTLLLFFFLVSWTKSASWSSRTTSPVCRCVINFYFHRMLSVLISELFRWKKNNAEFWIFLITLPHRTSCTAVAGQRISRRLSSRWRFRASTAAEARSPSGCSTSGARGGSGRNGSRWGGLLSLLGRGRWRPLRHESHLEEQTGPLALDIFWISTNNSVTMASNSPSIVSQAHAITNLAIYAFQIVLRL